VIVHKDGEVEVLLAPKAGTIYSIQESIVSGSDLSDSLEDGDLCVVGRFLEMQPAWTARGVDAPQEAIFADWKIATKDPVHTGDVIAEVLIPKTKTGDRAFVRRLEEATEWETMQIKAPTWGWVDGKQPLKPGMTVGNQQIGSTIASINNGIPWWIWVLCILFIQSCCLYSLFRIMKKPVPEPRELSCDIEPLLINEAPNWADKQFVLNRVQLNGDDLRFADDNLKADKEVVLAAVTNNGNALQYAGPQFNADKDVVLAAVTNDRNAFQYVDKSSNIWTDRAYRQQIIRGLTGRSISFRILTQI